MVPKNKIKPALKWTLAGSPLLAVVGASFFPLQAWAQQALVLVTLLWFMVFFLLDCFYLAG